MNVFQRARPYLAVAMLLGTAHCVFGHDTFQTTVIGKPDQENLEVRITLSGFAANALLRQSGVTVPGGVASSFDSLRPKLVELAGRMIEVSVDNVALSLTSAVVVPGEEGDVEFELTYPRPAKRELQLHAAYLTQLGKGYTAQLTLFNEAGGGSILYLKNRDQPVVAWSLDSGARPKDEAPIAAAIPQPAAVADASSPASVIQPLIPSPTQEQKTTKGPAGISHRVLIVVLVCAAGFAFLMARRKCAR